MSNVNSSKTCYLQPLGVASNKPYHLAGLIAIHSCFMVPSSECQRFVYEFGEVYTEPPPPAGRMTLANIGICTRTLNGPSGLQGQCCEMADDSSVGSSGIRTREPDVRD